MVLDFEGWVEGVSIGGKSTSSSMRVTMACRNKRRKKKKSKELVVLCVKNELEHALLKEYNSNNNIFKQRVTFSVQLICFM